MAKKAKKEVLRLIKRPDERTPAPVRDSWTRIEKWLKENLPKTFAALRGPVSKADLKRFEKTIGQKLPDDVAESWRIHDGQLTRDPEDPDLYIAGVLFGFHLISLCKGDYSAEWCWKGNSAGQKSYDKARADADLDCKSFPIDSTLRVYGSPGWIALHENASANYLGIDLTPGPNGRMGQVISFGRDQNPQYVIAVSWAHFLEDVADEMEAGNGVIEVEKLPPDLDEDLEPEVKFRLKSNVGWFSNTYEQWAKAKLPKAFQKAKPVKRPAPKDPSRPVDEPLAKEASKLVLDFVAAMHKLERKFLKRLTLNRFGIKSAEFRQDDDWIGWGMEWNPGEIGETPEQTLMWSNAPYEEKQQLIERSLAGFPKEQGFAARAELWGRFLTPRKRDENALVFRDPPEYDPSRIRIADVRQLTKKHLFVVTEPTAAGEGVERTYRYQLRLKGDRWLIDDRERIDSDRIRLCGL